MRRCMSRNASPSSSHTRYLPRRPSRSTRRPSSASRTASGASGRHQRGSAISSAASTRPSTTGASWRRIVSTSGSSGIPTECMAVVLTWNVAGRVRGQEAQLSVLAEAPFDVLCLQEVTPTTRARWEAALGELGLHVAVSEWPVAPRGSRRFAVLVAAREPLAACPPLDLPWPERHLAVRVAGLEVHTLHAPLSAKEGQVKVRTLEAVFAALDGADDGVPRVLTGDLNTPRYESREGEIFTFARTAGGRRPAAAHVAAPRAGVDRPDRRRAAGRAAGPPWPPAPARPRQGLDHRALGAHGRGARRAAAHLPPRLSAGGGAHRRARHRAALLR